MKKTFCTIIDNNYINYALTLNDSLLNFNKNALLKIFISDQDFDFTYLKNEFPNLEFYYVSDICNEGIGKRIFEKYAKVNKDCFRWSMKSVFIKELLKTYDKVIFLDSDLFFFSSYDFLCDKLDQHNILLTPHWRSSDPYRDQSNFSILQTSGMFNAGFIGVSKQGTAAMDWWGQACEYECSKKPEKGLFGDQAYLNLFPVLFDKVRIVRHKGCNVANWNQIECKRILTPNGEVKINGSFDIVFIHFTKSTIDGIQSGQDSYLKPHLEQYLDKLGQFSKWVPAKSNVKHGPVRKNFSINIGEKKPKNKTANFIDIPCVPQNIDIFGLRKAIQKSLEEHLPEMEGVILDVGCGQKPYRDLILSEKSSVTNYIGLDFTENPIHDNDPEITWQKGKIPLQDKSIDSAICTEVLEHCPDPENILKEIYRVLRPGGNLFLTVPFLWPLHEVPFDECRYTPFSLERHLINSGFSNVKIKGLGGWDASLAQMIGLWVRRRGLNHLTRSLFSFLAWPIVVGLLGLDKKRPIKISENTMITGIVGIAKR